MYLVCINSHADWELAQVIQISKTLFIAVSFGIDAMSARCWASLLFVFPLSFSRWYKNGVEHSRCGPGQSVWFEKSVKL